MWVLNEEDKVHEFCGYLKLMTPAYLHDDFSQSIHLSVHHLNGSTDIWNLQSSTTLEQIYNHEVSCCQNFCMKILPHPIQKYNSKFMHGFNRKPWVGIFSYIIFPLRCE